LVSSAATIVFADQSIFSPDNAPVEIVPEVQELPGKSVSGSSTTATHHHTALRIPSNDTLTAVALTPLSVGNKHNTRATRIRPIQTPSRSSISVSAGVKRRVMFDAIPATTKAFQVLKDITNVSKSSPSTVTVPHNQDYVSDELSRLRSSLKLSNDKVKHLKKVANLKNEVSPKMINGKIDEVFGRESSIAHLISSQFKRYEYSKAGIQRYTPYEKALSLTIYYSTGRKGYE